MTANYVRKLDRIADAIYTRVVSELQDADELGGIEDKEQYRHLMRAVIQACNERLINADALPAMITE